MFRKIQIFLVVGLSMLSPDLISRDTIKTRNNTHSLSFILQASQFKDEFNYGLVYRGLNFLGRYYLKKDYEKSNLLYKAEMGFGGNYNKGAGIALLFKPIDVFYGYSLKMKRDTPLLLGAYFTSSYNWQFYPELQAGHMFWFTSIEIGPQAVVIFPIKQKKIRITLANSIAGFVSRPEPSIETYYYSLAFQDFIRNANSNFKFGTLDLFNHTKLEIEFLQQKDKRMNLAYEINYFGYYDEPKLNYLTNSLNIKWKLGKL